MFKTESDPKVELSRVQRKMAEVYARLQKRYGDDADIVWYGQLSYRLCDLRARVRRLDAMRR